MATYPELPARYYLRLGELLQRMGIEPLPLLLQARLHPQQLQDPGAQLRLEQVEALVTAANAASGRTDLAFELGRSLRLATHSIVGYGILSSPTLDYAMRLTSRFFRLLTPTMRMRYRLDAAAAEIRFEPVLPLSRAGLLFHVEAVAVAMHIVLRELLGEGLQRYQLQLSIAEPPHAARYAELEGARVQFGWADGVGIRMLMSAALMGRAPALADPAALKLAEDRCRVLLDDAVSEGRMADWVRMMLREASGGLPSLEDLAHTLNLSARTLDRHLQREGSGFRALQQEILRERACALLEAGRLSVTQIAHELGYTDAANFSRAFKRDTGVSPRDWRPS
jgi:AraC-like DNA-binding protein